MKLYREEVVKHRALGVVLAQAHSTVTHSLENQSTFPKALVACGTRVGHEEMLPPCGHSL